MRGQSDPMDVDRHGINFLTGYYGTSSGHLWLLNQEEFENDILQCGNLAIHAIAHTFANPFIDKISSPPESWGSSLRKLLHAGVALSPSVPEMGTPLDTLLMSITYQVDSGLVAQEWLSLLSSVGVDIEIYVMRERYLHPSGFVHRVYPTWLQRTPDEEIPRRLIFEEMGSPRQHRIRWEWFYGPESPAHLALSEFSSFGDLFHWSSRDFQLNWPFIYLEVHKDLGGGLTLGTKECGRNYLSKMKILQARWARQAARRHSRSRIRSWVGKPSRTERRLQVPGSWVEDHMPPSSSRQQTYVFNNSWWRYLFIMGFAFLISRAGLPLREENGWIV
jgi:hypothetical protein